MKIKEEDIKENEEAQILKNRINNLDNMESVFYSVLNYHPIMNSFEITSSNYIDDQYDFKKTLESAFDYMVARRGQYNFREFKGKTGGKFKSLQITQTGKKELNQLINCNKSSLSYGRGHYCDYYNIEFNVKIIDGKGKWLNSFDIMISIDVNADLEITDMKCRWGRHNEATKI